MKELLDILIQDALIYDGSGGQPFSATVGIKNKKIVYVGKEFFDSKVIVDCRGLCLCPGFIDTHGHSEFTILSAPTCDSKILQGITTEVNGNCGLSAAPLLGEAMQKREEDLRELGITERWSELSEYFSILKERKIAINFLTLTGHGNIRASIKGYEDGKATDEEIYRMFALLERALLSGSFGISTGLIYPPGVFTETAEIIRLFRPLKDRYSLIYATHMRSEGDRLLESVKESIEIGQKTGVKVHISHLKTSGEENWYKVDEALELIDDALRGGVQVSFDRYPYTAASTDLDTLLPDWTYEGGNDAEMQRLLNAKSREEVIQYLRTKHKDRSYYDSVIVSSVNTEKNKWMEGMNVSSISEALNRSPEESILAILTEEKLRVSAIFMSMNEDNLRKFLRHPLCMVGSDSSIRSFGGVTAQGKPHPRGFGTFPRFLRRYVMQENIVSLEEGLRKITSLPAKTFGIKDRGLIKENYFADIVLFDPNIIEDFAEYNDPYRKSDGIEYVIVNGTIVVSRGELLHNIRPGMIIRAHY